jgi:electron transport complex protein RnfB
VKKSNLVIVLLFLGVLFTGILLPSTSSSWIIDADKCNSCGKCAEFCVKPVSAVKAEINYKKLPSLELHPSMFKSTKSGATTARENRICPTDAIKREQLSDSSWNYQIKDELCIGCGACAIRSKKKAKGAFALHITESCLDCNECSIAIVCPTGAISRRSKR